MGKFLKGWLMLIVGMYALQIVLYLADNVFFHDWLQLHYVAGTNGGTKPGSALLIGGTTWYLLIFVAFFAGMYYLLVRFKILPKDPFGQRSQAQSSARAAREVRDARAAGRPIASPPLPSGVNPNAVRTRAERREVQRRVTTTAAVAAPKRSLLSRIRPQPTAVAEPIAVAKSSLTTTPPRAAAATATKPASGSRGKSPAVAATPISADHAYERVRAEQRQRKRRSAKR
jgi:uncharacterized membrane protein